MRARGRQRDQHIARLDLGAIDQLLLLGNGDTEAGQIEITVLVHAGHLCGLAADQRTTGLLAALGNALDDRRGDAGIELAGGVVIEEEQRLGAVDQHIVDAHRDQILAQPFDPSGFDTQPQLGADAIGAGHQHWLLVLLRQGHQRAETTDAAEHFRPMGRLDDLLDVIDQRVAAIDIDAGIGVAQ